jgi:periplasmic copper chaperone A
MKRIVLTLSAVVISALVLGGCGPSATPTLSIEGAWGRPSPTMAGAGGIYMLIKNTGGAADKLVSGKSDACGMVEVHQTVTKADGTMGMNLVAEPVEIPAGGQLELKAGGMHVMCMMAKADQFQPGGHISLTLVFEKSGAKTVTAEIREK